MSAAERLERDSRSSSRGRLVAVLKRPHAKRWIMVSDYHQSAWSGRKALCRALFSDLLKLTTATYQLDPHQQAANSIDSGEAACHRQRHSCTSKRTEKNPLTRKSWLVINPLNI
jgi:hypothetical protein